MQARSRQGQHPTMLSRSWPLVVVTLAAVVLGCTSGDDGSAESPPDDRDPAEMTVTAEGLELRGTLRLPDSEAPYTGIVIAHGSGPSSRRGEAPGQLGLTLPAPVPVYEQLAQGLRDAGYAVVTFDKRTCGPFNGCADNGYPTPPDDLQFGTFVDDVGAVVDDLVARDDIERVVVAGHSKGGTVAAQLAAGRDDLDGLVLLATPAVGVPELLATQAVTFQELVVSAGQTGPQVDSAVDELESLAASVAAVAAGDLDGPPIGGASRAFWASWIEAADAAPEAISDTGVPVLVVGGANDWNVLPSHVEAWSPALTGVDDDLVLLDDVTHALTRLDEEDPAAITPADVGSSVDQRVIDTMADWLDDVSAHADER